MIGLGSSNPLQGLIRRLSPGTLRARPALTIGTTLFGGIAAACFIIPAAWSYSPDALVALPYQAPSFSHPFGTDSVGRDLFVRTFAGGRIDLIVATIAIGTSLLLGTLVGTLSGSTSRRWVDNTLMRIVDALIAFPFVILILVLVVLVGPDRSLGPAPAGLPATLIAFLIVGWAYYARLARAQALSLSRSDYILAAQVLGYSRARIVLKHLSPGVFRVTSAYAVGDAILVVVVVASLAFLGAGVQPPTPEWGNIMFEGRSFLQSAWWITVAPGALLALTGLSLSLIADSLLIDRDAPG
jgi:peptide/nickel transport system permease protein